MKEKLGKYTGKSVQQWAYAVKCLMHSLIRLCSELDFGVWLEFIPGSSLHATEKI